MKHILIEQQDLIDCGPACLAMIGQYYGVKSTIAHLREVTKTDRQGTNIKGLMDGASSLGLDVWAGKCLFEENIDIEVPCIMHVIKDDNLLHYVVLWETINLTVTISDPADGVVELPKQNFLSGDICNVQEHSYQWSGVILFFISTQNTVRQGDREKNIIGEFLKIILNRKISFGIFFLSLLSAVINVIIAFFYQVLIDKIIPGEGTKYSVWILLAFILFISAKSIFDLIRVQLTLLFNKGVHSQLTYKFYQHLLHLPQKFFDHRTVGELVARLQDVNAIQDVLTQLVLIAFVDALSVLISSFVLIRNNKMMYFILLIQCFVFIVIVIFFRNSYTKLNKKQLEKEAELTSLIVEGLTGNVSIKIYNAAPQILLRLKRRLNNFWESVCELSGVENIQYAMKDWIGTAGELVLLWIGGSYVIQGKLTLGELIMFNALSVYLLMPVRNLINLQAQMQTAIVAYKRTQEIMELDIEAAESEIKKADIQGNIVFKNINFRYGMQPLILENLNMEILQNKRTAIIGESGIGKSTIAKLIMRLYSPESGEITINDIGINKFNLHELRKEISYVPQNIFLFTGTLKENLTLGLDDIKDSKIVEVCKIVGIHDFIMALPFQYQTIIGENGTNLSGGQKQKIGLAKAVLRNPKILVLDEATSNIDQKSEEIFWDNLFTYLKNVTIIIIAHKSCVISKCDKVYKIKNRNTIKLDTHVRRIKS